MVAVINTGRSLRAILQYNENKVTQGVAQCIGEGNYPMETARMNLSMKLSRLANQAALNENVKRNSVHISLNFHPSESYPREKLMEIAHSYMEKIGFADQPYLVYQHHDAGHPHIHLVSVKIRADGSRIDMQNIGRNQSEKARKEIEKAFGLLPAEGRSKLSVFMMEPVGISRVCYGKTETKKAISNVLQRVLGSYRFTSLAELNAVLGLYQIRADRGSENSRIFSSGGLVYRILDQRGKPAGIPIKASDFSMKPTLGFLEGKFASNTAERPLEKKRIRNAVDTAFFKKELTLDQLIWMLAKDGIHAVPRKSETGILYGITYVDHVTKCVFNGSALGRNYSAKAVGERCETSREKEQSFSLGRVREKDQVGPEKHSFPDPLKGFLAREMQGLLMPEQKTDYVSGMFKGRRKKRKRKGRSDPN